MTMRPVVVGVDGSEESLRAAEWSAVVARRRGAPLRIVSAPASPPRLYAVDLSPETVGNALRGLSAHALSAALVRAEAAAPGLRIDTGLLLGPPALAVAAAASGAAMLVVGARGAGGFTTMVLGSVSRYAATRAPCPVVVLREGSLAKGGEIVVGISGPEDGNDALAFAFEEAASRGAELVAVHAWSWADSGLGAPPGDAPAEAAAKLADALAPWRDKYLGVTVREDVVHGHPAWVLASYSARAGLVVLGRHPEPSIASIHHTVLDHARGPIAIVPSGS
jgi:nucleotide-binding universal stress UspA family protein